jgi:hypothetical protein
MTEQYEAWRSEHRIPGNNPDGLSSLEEGTVTVDDYKSGVIIAIF